VARPATVEIFRDNFGEPIRQALPERFSDIDVLS
jgi:hypothetical protein